MSQARETCSVQTLHCARHSIRSCNSQLRRQQSRDALPAGLVPPARAFIESGCRGEVDFETAGRVPAGGPLQQQARLSLAIQRRSTDAPMAARLLVGANQAARFRALQRAFGTGVSSEPRQLQTTRGQKTTALLATRLSRLHRPVALTSRRCGTVSLASGRLWRDQ